MSQTLSVGIEANWSKNDLLITDRLRKSKDRRLNKLTQNKIIKIKLSFMHSKNNILI